MFAEDSASVLRERSVSCDSSEKAAGSNTLELAVLGNSSESARAPGRRADVLLGGPQHMSGAMPPVRSFPPRLGHRAGQAPHPETKDRVRSLTSACYSAGCHSVRHVPPWHGRAWEA